LWIWVLKIDNKLSEAYWILGYINTFRNWDWKEAERNFKQALEINPNSTLAHIFYSNLLTFTGRNEEAIFEAECAQVLDPFSAFINTYTGLTYQWAGQNNKGIEELKMALTVSPNFFLAQFNLGVNYRLQGMYEEAVIEYEKAVALSSGYPFAIACLIANYFRVGKIDQAEILFTDLKIRSITEYVPATSFYLVYAQLGEVELALESLKRACEDHDSFLLWLRSNPLLIPEKSKYITFVKERGLDF
jgi:tetratricopeptide (TPR) repeat protein